MFLSSAWSAVEPETPFVDGWHLGAICEHLTAVTTGEIRNLVINIPPRHCKSLACGVFWPAWVWARTPHSKWLCASYAESIATRDSLRMRRLIESRWFRLRFPDVILAKDQKAKTRYENTSGGCRIATTVLGSATGEGGDYIMVDDAHKVMEAESQSQRERVVDWWNQTMSTRGNDPKTVARVVIGQRVHGDDLCGHLEDAGGYEHLVLPAEWDGEIRTTSIGWREPRKEDGELLWPDRFGQKEIDDIKTNLGPYGAAAQLQQRPVPREGGIIQEGWLKRCKREDLPTFERIVQSWDMTFKATRGSYVVGQAWGVAGVHYYLIDQERGRWGFNESVAAIKRLTARHPECIEILVEDAANGPAIIDHLKNTINGIVRIRPDGSKEARLSAVSPLFANGQVFVVDGPAWVDGYEAELLTFPMAANDDQVDATSQALRRIARTTNVALFPPRKRFFVVN
jgi:predicted phage terminase large subunit-like protein